MADDPDTLCDEIWKSIPFADGYSVSSLGRFRSDRRQSRKWAAGPRKVTVDSNGYSYVRFLCGGKKRKEWLHRLIAMVFISAPPSARHEAAHIDGNPANNVLANIRWATPQENNADKKRHGTLLVGESLPVSKLTAEAVEYIRTSPLSGSALAKKFGVSRRAIDRARSGESWGHVAAAPVRLPQWGRHY